MATEVTLSDLAKEIDRFSRAHLEQQKAAVVRGLARSLPMLAQRSPVDQGQYANSWDLTVTESEAIIGNFAPHSPIIEYGTRGGYLPPLAPLLAWAKRVLNDPSQPPDYSDEVQGLARGTQWKIYHYGIVPKHILRDALPDMIENIKAEFLAMGG